ncbi:MAG: hypothetical protein U0232_12660 [Thermomicrobiales bacterium]
MATAPSIIHFPAPATGRGDPNPRQLPRDAYSGRVRLIDSNTPGDVDLAGDLADLIEGPRARHVPRR